MYSVILCGGSGTRLWPLSRKNFPKQFLSLYSEKSLLQETYLRMKKIMPEDNIFFVTNKENYLNVLEQIKKVRRDVKKSQILAEPENLNTAPAITYAVKYLEETIKAKKDAPIIFLPSDHYIGKESAYLGLVKKAMKETKNHIGTIGITPTKPETGYGYIKKGKREKDYFSVLEFKEKPDKKTAEKYMKSGKYVWNSGMYIFNIQTFISELSLHSPQIYSVAKNRMAIFLKKFGEMPSISLDVAISEKSKNMVVFEGEFGWSDIGSFDSLADILSKRDGFKPKHISIDSENIFTHSSSGRRIVTVGVEDLIIVEDNDNILIQKRGRGEDVKKIVEYLKKKKFRV